jgi:predicted DNA-binding transcriptional regulator AlpA
MASAGLSPRDLSLPRFALRRDEAAASLGISETTFDKWVELGRMPRSIKIDGVVLWDVQQVFAYWNKLKDPEGAFVKNPFDEVIA